MLSALLAIGAALAAAGISGIIFSRNFVAIMFAVELIIISGIVIAVSFINSFINASTAAGAMLLISLWAIAAAEAIATVTLYAFMKARGSNFRVDKLNLLKW